jgi:DNA/RNA-binding protein KIN17
VHAPDRSPFPMGGGDAGLKAIAKRQKQNGLGRLRLYCQMCEKQCRDENGFKCHAATPAHQRNLVLFASQPEIFVDRFSKHFLAGFLGVLQQRYGCNPVAANTVYQDYIKDKEHVHMNSTQWTTLSEFTKYLGRCGACRVEERSGALWVVFIDREATERRLRAQEMDRARLDEEERAEQNLARLMHQVERHDVEKKGAAEGPHAADAGPIDLSLKGITSHFERHGPARSPGDNAFKSLASSKRLAGEDLSTRPGRRRKDRPPRSSVLDEIMAEERGRERSAVPCQPAGPVVGPAPVPAAADLAGRVRETHGKMSPPPNVLVAEEASGDSPPWVAPGIVVKCVAKSLSDGPYYRKKGTVESVVEQYTAVVRLADSGAVLQLDQDDLETVIPKPGGTVMFVRGERRGQRGSLQSIEGDSFSASVRLDSSQEVVTGVDYEYISKLR